ncbi:MAG: tyrosine-protein phosphatase [Pseudomonadota bacterium]
MSPPYLLECEFCAATGQDLIDINHLSARKAPSRAALLALVDTMRCTPKPFLFHCKSGADRTSLAAAIYLMVFEGAPVSTARRQFSVRFLHLKWTKSGVLDHILDVFENEAEPRGIDFETWLRTEYDGSKIQRSFHEGRA